MDKTNFTRLVREFRFKELFNQMGWDNASGSFQIELKGNTFTISVICEKSGFRFKPFAPVNFRERLNFSASWRPFNLKGITADRVGVDVTFNRKSEDCFS